MPAPAYFRPAAPVAREPRSLDAPHARLPDPVRPVVDRVDADPAIATTGPLRGIRYGRELAAAAAAYHLDPALVAGVAAQESGGPGQMNGRADAGKDNPFGHGLMQINPQAWPWAKTHAVWDPAQNALKGAQILRGNLDAAGGNVRDALAIYNRGRVTSHTDMTQWNDGRKDYPSSVLRHQQQIVMFETRAR